MKNKTEQFLDRSSLGKSSPYVQTYTPTLLFPLPRLPKREEIQVGDPLPFTGFDLWTGYEISWLNPKGKPVVAIAEFQVPCESRCLIESKSFKLYLNSLNQSSFESFESVRLRMAEDLSQAAEAPVEVTLFELQAVDRKMGFFEGVCVDLLDVECTRYEPQPSFLKTTSQEVEETIYSDLLKSNCLVTGQPDWGSVQIRYKGRKIDPEGFLKYIVSFRNHNEFHEQCVERIFMDLLRECQPTELSVYARYTRRGGLEINPFRTLRRSGDLVSGEGMDLVSRRRLVRQ